MILHAQAPLLYLLVMLAAIGNAQTLPRACVKDALLTGHDPGVVVHAGHFALTGGRDFPFRTFSLAEMESKKDATDRSMCFRYEIQNMGSEPIQALSWPDIDLEFVDIAPKPTVTVLRTFPTNFDSPSVANTKLEAFANAHTDTRAYLTTEKAVKVNASKADARRRFSSSPTRRR